MANSQFADLENTIENAFDNRDNINIDTQGEIREAVVDCLELLDRLLTEAVHLGFSSQEVLALASERAGNFHWQTKA